MIQLENLTHSFLDSTKILKDVNLNINKSEIFGLVGDTGSGKSTLLRIMNGFIEPSFGQVKLMGKDLTHDTKHELVRRTSMIFQDFNLLSNLTVLDNVLLPSKLRKNNDQEKALKYLNYVGLNGFENRLIKSLSGGQKQRVAIARTLMTDPEIIFCDEPTSALDSNMRNEILNLLNNINKDLGTTIVIVSHDINVIKSLCDCVAIIEDGKVNTILEIRKEEIINQSYLEALSHD